MQREDQIDIAARKYADKDGDSPSWIDMRDGFIAGAEWADQNPNWINVKEKEPPESMVWDKRIFFLGLTDEGGIHKMYRLADPTICKDLENDNLYLHVTYWMPIPPMPKNKI